MLDPSNGGIPAEGISRSDFLKVAGAAGLVVTASGTVLSVVADSAKAQDDTIGQFGPLFVEPVIYFPEYYVKQENNNKPGRVRTNEECIPPPKKPEQKRRFCKPAAGSNALLPDKRFLFWNALEGTEDSERFGTDTDKAQEDSQSRVIKIKYDPDPAKNGQNSEFLKPFRSTGSSPGEVASELIPGITIEELGNDREGNDADMFCSSQTHLPGGSVLVVGGTNWYTELGAVELEGTSRSRFFDPKANKWFRTGDMNLGRWYPALVSTADGTPYVFGGVHKLEKPIYLPPREPGEPQSFDSGQNVREVERLDLKTGKWKIVGNSDEAGSPTRRSLPLQPRMHLLPNGHVSYNGCGQAFSPNGQDPTQPSWNICASFDPKTKIWTEHGITGTGCVEPQNIGSKLSCFEVPLLLEADENGDYKTIVYVSGGGTNGAAVATNPGTYFANNQSRISTWFTPSDDPLETTVTHADTGPMFNALNSETVEGDDRPPEEGGAPLGRWFGDAALLPTGEIFVSGGADRDEVFFPGIEFPIIECEIFDPSDTTDSPNGSWSVVGGMTNIRTYHNTNSLVETGEVIIGGHAPIPFGYVSHDSDVVPGTRNSDGRDPTFQLWSPPYVGNPERPSINVKNNGAKDPLKGKTGGRLKIPTSDGANIEDVVIMRLPSSTHLNDTETRGLILPVVATTGSSVSAKMPKTLAELGGPGFYLAFIRALDSETGKPLPSEGVYVKVKK